MHLLILSLGTEIDVGFLTKTTLKCLITSGDIPSSKEQVFLNGAYAFFQKVYECVLSHLRIDDLVLGNAEFVRFEDRESLSLSMPQFFVQR